MKKVLLNSTLILASLLFTLAALEAGVRIVDRESRWINFLGEERTMFTSAYPSEFHPLLGWVPKEGQTTGDNVWGKTATILEHGIRSNGAPPDARPANPPIVAVGDSFTFGDQVNDAESWPALLERLSGRRVINGGVFGYGFDQSFLRAGQLTDIFKPEMILLGLIPDDILRCETSARGGVEKPYFIVAGDNLILKNVPVPRPHHRTHEEPVRFVLGRIYLAHKLFMRCCPHWWLMGVSWDQFYEASRIHRDGDRVACALVGELNRLARNNGIREVLIVVQYTEKPTTEAIQRIERLKSACDAGKRVRILDLYDDLDRVRRTDPERYRRMFDRHMTAEGNAFVAQRVHAALQGRDE